MSRDNVNRVLVRDYLSETVNSNFNNTTENTIMSQSQQDARRTVTVELIDDDKGLPTEHSLVFSFRNILTQDSDDVTIQEIIMNKDVKGALELHNKTRTEVEDLDILNRTGNQVKLRPVKLKDLRWVVK